MACCRDFVILRDGFVLEFVNHLWPLCVCVCRWVCLLSIWGWYYTLFVFVCMNGNMKCYWRTDIRTVSTTVSRIMYKILLLLHCLSSTVVSGPCGQKIYHGGGEGGRGGVIWSTEGTYFTSSGASLYDNFIGWIWQIMCVPVVSPRKAKTSPRTPTTQRHHHQQNTRLTPHHRKNNRLTVWTAPLPRGQRDK